MKRFLLITFLALISISYAPTDESNNSVSLSVSFNEQAARSTTYEKQNTFDTSILSSTKKEQADLLVVEDKFERKTLEEDSEIVVLESEEQKRTENGEAASKTVIKEVEEETHLTTENNGDIPKKTQTTEINNQTNQENVTLEIREEETNILDTDKEVKKPNVEKKKETKQNQTSQPSNETVITTGSSDSSDGVQSDSTNKPSSNLRDKEEGVTRHEDGTITVDLEYVDSGNIPVFDEDGNLIEGRSQGSWIKSKSISGVDLSDWIIGEIKE